MKIKSFTVSLFALCVFSLSAQTVYYVDAENGNDANPGTQEQPWATLNGNVETWRTTDCTIHLAEGSYDVVSKIFLGGNVEFVGAGVDKVFIQQCNDEDFEGDRYGNVPYVSNGFFDISGNKAVKMSNLTIKNLRVGDVENTSTPYWGGAITVQQGSSLELNTVDFYHCIIPVGGGAGIDCKGSLDLTNVRFTECEASLQGAAISLAGDAIGKFEGCSFVRNTGTTTIQVYPVETTADNVCADLRFNNCYFDSNDYSKAQYGCGINVGNFYGHKLIFHVTNTTFANNLGNSAGCMFITTDINKQRVIDMKVENCIFMNNDMTTATHASVFSINGSSSNTLTGDITFANNTFYHNDRPDGSTAGAVSDIFYNDQSVNLNFLNNIFLTTNGKGYGPVFSSDIQYTKVNFKNNIFESVGGGENTMVLAFQDGGIKVGQSEDEEKGLGYIDGNTEVKLDLELIPQGDYKAPYLRLQEGSVAIDAGYDDGGTLVPTLDIRGVGVYNEKKDVGAYEYDNGGSSVGMMVSPSLKVFVTNNMNTVAFSEEVANVKAFAINGAMVKDYSSVQSFDVSDWSRGAYILVVTDMEGNIYKFKVLR